MFIVITAPVCGSRHQYDNLGEWEDFANTNNL